IVDDCRHDERDASVGAEKKRGRRFRRERSGPSKARAYVGRAMTCPLYLDQNGARCLATEDELAPSVYERERYCLSDGCVTCPTLIRFRRTGTRLSEEEYLRQWLPDFDEDLLPPG